MSHSETDVRADDTKKDGKIERLLRVHLNVAHIAELKLGQKTLLMALDTACEDIVKLEQVNAALLGFVRDLLRVGAFHPSAIEIDPHCDDPIDGEMFEVLARNLIALAEAHDE